MRRRQGFLLIGSVTVALGLFLACSFPDVTFAPIGSEAGAEDAFSKADAAIEDVVSRSPDSAVITDAAVCVTKPPCDCDEDGYLADGCDASAVDAAGKRFGDCDDLDALRHPEAGFVAEVPVGHNGDWDCDQRVERNPDENIVCSGNGLTGCVGAGFTTSQPCGTKGTFYACEGSGLFSCTAKPQQNDVPAACK